MKKDKTWKKTFGLVRYPGGKYYATRRLKDYCPVKFNTLISPFVGGGALEINLFYNERCDKLIINDNFKPLINLYKCAIKDNPRLERTYNKYLLTLPSHKSHDFTEREMFNPLLNDYQRASAYMRQTKYNYPSVRHGSFSKSTCSRDTSKNYTDYYYKTLYQKNIVCHDYDFEKFLNMYKDGYTYLDPPYYKAGSHFYKMGNYKNKKTITTRRLASNFNHKKLRDILSKRNKWVLSYDNHPVIKEMYKDISNIYYETWIYSIKPGHDRFGHIELVITSKDITPPPNAVKFNNVKRITIN